MPLRCAEVTLTAARPDKPMADPREVRIIQAEYGHEIAVLLYDHDTTLQTLMTRSQPVRIVWGLKGETSTFVGYVHHLADDQRPASTDTRRYVRVVCVGATDVLNSPASRQYRNATVAAVVSDVVRANQLSVLIEKHPFLWPQLEQNGDSDWAFLVATAKRIGWTLYGRNTDVRCHSRAIRYAGAQPFRFYGGDQSRARGVIHGFTIVQAETLAGNARKRRFVTTGVDQTGTVFTASTDPQRDLAGPRATDASLVAFRAVSSRSIAEANAVLAGEQELNRHYITAKATLSGSADVHAGGCIRMLGLGKDHDGYWFATRVEHIITQGGYNLSVEVGKDSLGDPAAPINGSLAPLRAMPGDTALRRVVHDGLALDVTAANRDRNVPPSIYTGAGLPDAVVPFNLAPRWRAGSIIERFMKPAARPAPVLSKGA